MTTWKPVPVPGYGRAYEVSDDGQVRSLDRRARHGKRLFHGVTLAGGVASSGYRTVRLSVEGNKATWFVHQLVLLAHVGPRPERGVVRHLDGDRLNNAASNLAWGTITENAYDTVRHGRNKWAARTHCPQGHPYSGENLVRQRSGGRKCRECERARNRRRQPQATIRQREKRQAMRLAQQSVAS